VRRASSIDIRPMTHRDTDEVCAVVGEAFSDNPSTLANVRGGRKKANRVMRDAVRIAKFGRAWSNALVAMQGGDVAGVLNAAECPHCQLGGFEKVKTAPAMLWIMRSSAQGHEDDESSPSSRSRRSALAHRPDRGSP
jgi:hypothetical protein